jgi:hypothetical protein
VKGHRDLPMSVVSGVGRLSSPSEPKTLGVRCEHAPDQTVVPQRFSAAAVRVT